MLIVSFFDIRNSERIARLLRLLIFNIRIFTFATFTYHYRDAKDETKSSMQGARVWQDKFFRYK